MYNVLIAEDSKPILRNLIMLLETSGLPIRVAATAVNGEEALNRFRSQSFDILLTDIRMPKMDGLTLIAEAKKLHPELKAVLISSYSDFEYTRKALNLQVSDYLLKPVEKSQLTEVLSNVLERLRADQPTPASLFRDLVDESGWRALEQDPEAVKSASRFLLARRQPFSGKGVLAPEPIRSALSLPPSAMVLQTASGDGVVILSGGDWPRNEADSPASLLEDWRGSLQENGWFVSLVSGLQPVTWNDLPEKIREASRLLEARMLVFRPLAFELSQPLPFSEPSYEEIDRLEDGYAALIQQLEKDRFLLLLSEQLAKWKTTGLRLEELRRFVRRLAASFVSVLESVGSLETAELPGRAERLLELADYETFRSELLAIAEEWLEAIRSSRRKSGPELFHQIDQYLRTNLYSNVAIQDLVDRFHVSPSYISRIVKRHGGQTFVNFYTDLKIAEARRLMETKPAMLIKEIAEVLCFGDQHYFSKVFKDRTGSSPLEYKSRLQESSETV